MKKSFRGVLTWTVAAVPTHTPATRHTSAPSHTCTKLRPVTQLCQFVKHLNQLVTHLCQYTTHLQQIYTITRASCHTHVRTCQAHIFLHLTYLYHLNVRGVRQVGNFRFKTYLLQMSISLHKGSRRFRLVTQADSKTQF